MKETELFEPVKNWLEFNGWEVYAEVFCFSGVADVVGKQGKTICVVEMKTSLTHKVIDQILRWSGYAHYKYIAIPKRRQPIPYYLQSLFRDKGVGILEVEENSVSRVSIPSRFRKAPMEYKWDLVEAQKTFTEAGSSGGAHWTPYKEMISNVKRFLRRAMILAKTPEDSWKSINEILDYCETYYAQPKPSLTRSLLNFEADWCEAEKRGNRKQWHFRHKWNMDKN